MIISGNQPRSRADRNAIVDTMNQTLAQTLSILTNIDNGIAESSKRSITYEADNGEAQTQTIYNTGNLDLNVLLYAVGEEGDESNSEDVANVVEMKYYNTQKIKKARRTRAPGRLGALMPERPFGAYIHGAKN